MTEEQLNEIKDDKNITHCYIRKNGSYYRQFGRGYTDYVKEAGVFIKEDALRQSESCSELDIIPINITEHNNMILLEVRDLLSRYIH